MRFTNDDTPEATELAFVTAFAGVAVDANVIGSLADASGGYMRTVTWGKPCGQICGR